ncbi:MAG: hypothetical protein IPP69_14710 [Flavobacteriales bacterium]|nr:hypothetical protein [Flavobacteriales bacterium]
MSKFLLGIEVSLLFGDVFIAAVTFPLALKYLEVLSYLLPENGSFTFSPIGDDLLQEKRTVTAKKRAIKADVEFFMFLSFLRLTLQTW